MPFVNQVWTRLQPQTSTFHTSCSTSRAETSSPQEKGDCLDWQSHVLHFVPIIAAISRINRFLVPSIWVFYPSQEFNLVVKALLLRRTRSLYISLSTSAVIVITLHISHSSLVSSPAPPLTNHKTTCTSPASCSVSPAFWSRPAPNPQMALFTSTLTAVLTSAAPASTSTRLCA